MLLVSPLPPNAAVALYFLFLSSKFELFMLISSKIYLLARKQKKIYVELLEVAPITLTLSFSSSPWMLRNGILTSGEFLIHRGLMALADVLWEPFLEPWNFQVSLRREQGKSTLQNSPVMTDVHLESKMNLNINVTESFIEPGSSYPVYIDDNTDEQTFGFKSSPSIDNLGDKKSADAQHHYIVIQLEGTSTLSTRVSIDLVGVSSGYVVPVVIDVSVQRYTNFVRLYSTVILTNATTMPFEVRFDIQFGVSPKILDPVVYPGHEFPLPLHLAESGCDRMFFSEIMKEDSDIMGCISSRVRHLVQLHCKIGAQLYANNSSVDQSIEDEKTTSDTSLFTLSEVDITLTGGETTLAQLSVTPRKEGRLKVTGVSWKLSDSMVGFYAFEPDLIKKRISKGRRKAKQNTNKLEFLSLPRLEGIINNLPSTVYTGNLQRLSLELRNSSEIPVKNLKMKISHPRFLNIGNPEKSDVNFPSCLEKEKTPSQKDKDADLDTTKKSDTIFHFPEDTIIHKETPFVLPLWFRAATPGNVSLYLTIYYEVEDKSTAMRYRTLRTHHILEVLPSLDVSFNISPCPSRLQEYIKISLIESIQDIIPSGNLASGQSLSCFLKLKNCKTLLLMILSYYFSSIRVEPGEICKPKDEVFGNAGRITEPDLLLKRRFRKEWEERLTEH
ncbi:unnamed protein product [Lactuca virosa]|uniref:TPPC8 second Ig-like domain-containing protein n=1 Tax=Lactuca virosa TaxID=75947 RepID=A0AAU9N6C4_9ASTR|nr:unnamed protein product [Lactuca virosa]